MTTTSELDIRRVPPGQAKDPEMMKAWIQHNDDGDPPHVVLDGHPVLDPLLNPDHPIHRSGKPKAPLARRKNSSTTETSKADTPPAELSTVENPMSFTVSKADAVALLEEMGYKKASILPPQRLKVKLENMPKNIDDEDPPTSKQGKTLLTKILNAVTGGRSLEIVEGLKSKESPKEASEPETAPQVKRGPGRPPKAQKQGSTALPEAKSNGKATAKVPVKAPKASKAETNGHTDHEQEDSNDTPVKEKVKKPTKHPRGEDKRTEGGTRPGSRFAKFEKALDKKPKTVPQLVLDAFGEIPIHEKSGGRQIGDFYRQMKKLVGSGRARAVDGGYVLAK